MGFVIWFHNLSLYRAIKKEEEYRHSLEPRYKHLNDELHVEITAYAAPAEAHARIALALTEIRRFLVPVNINLNSSHWPNLVLLALDGGARLSVSLAKLLTFVSQPWRSVNAVLHWSWLPLQYGLLSPPCPFPGQLMINKWTGEGRIMLDSIAFLFDCDVSFACACASVSCRFLWLDWRGFFISWRLLAAGFSTILAMFGRFLMRHLKIAHGRNQQEGERKK